MAVSAGLASPCLKLPRSAASNRPVDRGRFGPGGRTLGQPFRGPFHCVQQPSCKCRIACEVPVERFFKLNRSRIFELDRPLRHFASRCSSRARTVAQSVPLEAPEDEASARRAISPRHSRSSTSAMGSGGSMESRRRRATSARSASPRASASVRISSARSMWASLALRSVLLHHPRASRHYRAWTDEH